MRDYLHVMDLAAAHLKAVEYAMEQAGCEVFNLGTGRGCSVMEMVAAFEAVVGQEVTYCVAERRAGDVAALTADPSRANGVLQWRAKNELRAMSAHVWRWQTLNPQGYPK